MDDSPLIQEYASSRSDDAFKVLVDQYVGLVYSACLRQLKDRHLAEDATQAVFILLSQKAGGLRQTYLSGWLLTTSRYACANIRRSQQRRQRREQVVAMNQTTTTESASDDLLDLLDQGLCHLKSPDREALVLRYLKEEPIGNVAEKLGISEEAARKRVNRGVEKLRRYFSRRGITTTSTALGPILTDQLRGAVLTPSARNAMTQGILHACHAGPQGAAASFAIAKGAKTMMFIAKVKITAAAVLMVAALGTSGWMISRVLADNPSPAPALTSSAPVSVAEVPAPTTLVAIDLSTPEKTFAAVVTELKAGDRQSLYRCLVADPNRQPAMIDRVLNWNLAVNRMLAAGQQAYGPQAASQLSQGITIDEVMSMMAATGPGKRAVTSDTAELSTEVPAAITAMLPPDAQHVVSKWSGAPIRFKKQGDDWKFDIDRSLRVEMHNGPDGATEEQQTRRNMAILDGLTDAADQMAAKISAGGFSTLAKAARAMQNAVNQAQMRNGVRGWDMHILPADAGVASTIDGGAWSFHSDTPEVYSAVMDPNTLHDGHPTLRLGSEVAVREQTGQYLRRDRALQQYLGCRIRATAWIKSARVVNDAGIRIRVLNADDDTIADEGQRAQRPVRGTTDWKRYTAFVDVPANAATIRWGFILNGRGDIWVDLESAKLEIADGAGR